jgi:hypothetical protein
MTEKITRQPGRLMTIDGVKDMIRVLGKMDKHSSILSGV